MEVLDAIKARRSVRAYLPDTVPEEVLERILEAARFAPSAGNIQPWHFIVVTDPQKRTQISKGGRFARFLSESPTVIVGCGMKRSTTKWHVVDTTIAMQNMVLAATSEGLGTCWIGSFNEVEVKKLLRIPEEFTVVALLAIGYPREVTGLKSSFIKLFRRKKSIREIADREEFGNPFDVGKKSAVG
ncbi:MAG TPA: nitroreductase family protein [Candidatus Bathyarchaeia archaeon]|nr:nitroreductase family protein [Candidatus Bathyarchaeia archaeon]